MSPFYRLLERLPATREAAKRLGLVTIDQMVSALVGAVENPAAARVIEVPEIRHSRVQDIRRRPALQRVAPQSPGCLIWQACRLCK